MTDLINYLPEYKSFHRSDDSFLAQGQGRHFVRMEKLKEPVRRLDGRDARFLLDYRELSRECTDPDDESWCCVQSGDLTYWTGVELKSMGLRIARKQPENWVPEDFNIFEHISIL